MSDGLIWLYFLSVSHREIYILPNISVHFQVMLSVRSENLSMSSLFWYFLYQIRNVDRLHYPILMQSGEPVLAGDSVQVSYENCIPGPGISVEADKFVATKCGIFKTNGNVMWIDFPQKKVHTL